MSRTTAMVRLSRTSTPTRLTQHPGEPGGHGGSSSSRMESDTDRWMATALGCGQSLVEPLTARELGVLELLLDGAGNREIAARLAISPRTVETHLTNIYGKLGVRGRSEAILWTMQQALLARQSAGAARGPFLSTFTLIIHQPSRPFRQDRGRSEPGTWSTW